MRLTDKTAIVTGASRGIGTYICKTLARENIKIAGVARSKEGLIETQSNIRELGGEMEIFPFDLTVIDQIPNLITNIKNKMGDVQILINNAGIEKYNLINQYTDDEVNSILQTNLRAPIEFTRKLLPDFLENGGNIVNIASLAGKKGVTYNSLYSATKAGLLMWSDALRQEFKNTKINCSVICPGYIRDAGMFADSNTKAPGLLGTSSPQKVADAVIKALKSNHGREIIVNSGPIRPLLAIAQLFPNFGDKVTEWLGINKLNRSRVS